MARMSCLQYPSSRTDLHDDVVDVTSFSALDVIEIKELITVPRAGNGDDAMRRLHAGQGMIRTGLQTGGNRTPLFLYSAPKKVLFCSHDQTQRSPKKQKSKKVGHSQ